MPREVSERRAELLDQIVDYVRTHGLIDLSLRPLATALKTSPRMLLYFFGSKQQLIAEAMRQSRLRQQGGFSSALSQTSTRQQQLAMAWKVWSSNESEKSLSLFFESYVLAMRNRRRFPGLLEGLVKDWLPYYEQVVAAAGVEAKRVRPLATFILATIRGLQLDLLATDDRRRIDAAFREMLHLLSLGPDSRAKVRSSTGGKKRLRNGN
jgi:AcrR family transcriptional regulator